MSDVRRTVVVATGCAALSIAMQIGGKALRDTVFLSNHPVSLLPKVVIIAAVVSLLAALWLSGLFAKFGPRRVTTFTFIAAMASLGTQWSLYGTYPEAVAIALYLHMAAFGAVLISGFWSTVTEAFDVRTARQKMSTIATGATAGGLVGGVLAERIAAWGQLTMMYGVLIGGSGLCAIATWLLRPTAAQAKLVEAPESSSGVFRVLKKPYLGQIVLLVVIGTTAATLLDYVFKDEASSRFVDNELMRFFGAFYTAMGFLTFLVQAVVSGPFLKKFGVTKTTASLPAAIGAGALFGLMVPGFVSALVARSAELIARSSLFRSGYELLFAPLAVDEKRRAKMLIDVGADRAGDALGGLLVSALLLTALPSRYSLLGAALVMGIVLVWLMTRLHRGYIKSLENSLLQQGTELPMDQSLLGASVLLQSRVAMAFLEEEPPLDAGVRKEEDPEKILRRGKPAEIRKLLAGGIEPEWLRAVVDLLSKDETAPIAAEALKPVARENPDPLVAALTDGQTAFAIRRRIPRLLLDCRAEDVTEGLLAALADRRFEVRFQCGCVLYKLKRANSGMRVTTTEIYDVIDREVAVDRRLWDTHNQLSQGSRDDISDLIDDVLVDRADRSLQHIFHLLSLMHPAEALRVAYRGLHTDDQALRGTALEYLDTVLPDRVRAKLWPLLGEEESGKGTKERSGSEALESLMQSHASIELKLKDIYSAKAVGTSGPSE